MSDLHEKIDFSESPRLEVRPELFEEMLARRQVRQQTKSEQSSIAATTPAGKAHTSAKNVPLSTATLRWKMPMAIAASLLCVVGASFFAFDSNTPTHFSDQASTATSSFSTALKPSSSTTAETTEDALAETVDWYGSLGDGGTSEQLVVADAIFQSF